MYAVLKMFSNLFVFLCLLKVLFRMIFFFMLVVKCKQTFAQH